MLNNACSSAVSVPGSRLSICVCTFVLWVSEPMRQQCPFGPLPVALVLVEGCNKTSACASICDLYSSDFSDYDYSIHDFRYDLISFPCSPLWFLWGVFEYIFDSFEIHFVGLFSSGGKGDYLMLYKESLFQKTSPFMATIRKAKS